jgi:hypothetical protein
MAKEPLASRNHGKLRGMKVLACLLLAGCWTSGAAAPTKPAMTKPAETLRLEITTTAMTLPMSGRDAFEIGLRATNQSSAELEPRLDLADLTVNGESSMDWRMALGNGGRTPEWTHLPAGKTVELAWPLGNELFPAPGTYKLALTLSDVEGNHVADASPVTVTVTP